MRLGKLRAGAARLGARRAHGLPARQPVHRHGDGKPRVDRGVGLEPEHLRVRLQGDVVVLQHGKEKKLLGEVNMGSSVYATPVPANGKLFIMNRNQLYALQEGAQLKK